MNAILYFCITKPIFFFHLYYFRGNMFLIIIYFKKNVSIISHIPPLQHNQLNCIYYFFNINYILFIVNANFLLAIIKCFRASNAIKTIFITVLLIIWMIGQLTKVKNIDDNIILNDINKNLVIVFSIDDEDLLIWNSSVSVRRMSYRSRDHT